MLRNPFNSSSLVIASLQYGKSSSPACSQSPSAAFIPSTVFLTDRQLLWSSFEGNKRSQYPQQHLQHHHQQRLLVLCNNSQDHISGHSHQWDEHDGDYLEAYVVDTELLKHQQLRRQGFSGAANIWHSSDPLIPPINEEKESEVNHISSVESSLLRRFRNPTIFLRIACEGNLLLPIIVGEFAIGKLIDASHEDEKGGRPNQFQLMRNLVGTLGYEVRMVRITERVVNTYYARIYFGKPGEKAMLSVDARPSDAINLAKRCKVPIYVSKAIVATDAIKLVYEAPQILGKWRAKPSYDLSLDSAVDGPDPVAEELNLVRNMLIAVVEERYRDAALWRDELNKLRMSKQEL
eukprot:Gb_36898 [translate_table: standard]